MRKESIIEPTLYWSPPLRKGDGSYIWDLPDEIKARWDHRASLFYNEAGAIVNSSAITWVFHDVELGGYLWKGTLKEVTNFKVPAPDHDFTKTEHEYIKLKLVNLDIFGLAFRVVKLDKIEPLSSYIPPYIKKVYLG